MTISDHVWNLVHADETVTSVLAKDTKESPKHVSHKLFSKYWGEETHGNGKSDEAHDHGKDDEKGLVSKLKSSFAGLGSQHKAEEAQQFDKESLDRVAACGDFGSRPSDLFLKMYHDVLNLLEHNPLASFVSPPLLGSRGVMPMSIVSVIPDIIDHYQTCILRAETEIFLATNYWENSGSAKKIVAGLKKLSERAQERGKKVVVKVMYDRGAPKQVTQNHLKVEEGEFTGDEVGLPKRSELPGLDLEVVNYHRPVLGTFHGKWMIVDRKIALLNSNNIQDRPNVEMMTHLEGPIVSSLYDMSLMTWSVALDPPLPLLGAPWQPNEGGYKFGLENRWASERWLDGTKGAETAKQRAEKEGEGRVQDEGKGAELNSGEGDGKVFIGGRYESITDHINAGNQDTKGTYTPSPEDSEFLPHLLHGPQQECPMVLVNRKAHGRPGHGDTNNGQDVAWLAALKYAQKSIFIQTPTLNASPLIPALLAAVRRGIEVTCYVDVGFNDGGEALPFQGGTNEEVAKKMFAELKKEEKKNLKLFWYTAKDQGRPINAHINTRNCHVKIMIVDEQVGIQGNGNQDAQSWFHSQECNVMLDSAQICREWRECIESVQNTRLFGRVQEDGIWRDEKGEEAKDGSGVGSGPKGLIKGIQGSIKRVQGKGGF